jgi:REP element-mobilizing transposase RayT
VELPDQQNRERQRPDRQPDACTWLITFVCYGAWLHGESGAIDRNHNVPGARFLAPDEIRYQEAERRMMQHAYTLGDTRRRLVLSAIRETCDHRNWEIFAAHVRTTHVHLVVQSSESPEHMMVALKAYASRALNRAGLDGPDRRRWARHGSTIPVRNRNEASRAVDYVVRRQGEQMAVYEKEE